MIDPSTQYFIKKNEFHFVPQGFSISAIVFKTFTEYLIYECAWIVSSTYILKGSTIFLSKT